MYFCISNTNQYLVVCIDGIRYTSNCTHDWMLDMTEKERRVSERSLENLKLGAESRRQGKLRHNFTILPETVQWLKGTGNSSDAIDVLVEAARTGGLRSSDTHDWKDKEQVVSNDVYKQIETLQAELADVRLQLEKSQALEKDSTEQVIQCHRDGFKAAEILNAALSLPANAGGKIKTQIRKALELIDDV